MPSTDLKTELYAALTMRLEKIRIFREESEAIFRTLKIKAARCPLMRTLSRLSSRLSPRIKLIASSKLLAFNHRTRYPAARAIC